MAWSRIQNTQLAADAKAEYNRDPRRAYHNWAHVENLYWAAEHVYGFAYDEFLDKAILAHDVIYDDKPLKELRSGKWLLDRCMEDGIEHSFQHIMRTAKPAVTSDNRMIMLDYARLRDRSLILLDREKFLDETVAMCGVDELTFTKSNLAYFESVALRLDDHYLAALPRWERNVIREIRDGMKFSIVHSRNLLSAAA
jgi:hypothetical protein